MADMHTPIITDDTRVLGYRVGANVYTTTQEASNAILRGEGDSWIPLYCAHHAAPELLEALEQIERLSRTADAKLVNVRAMLGDIARAALSKARGEA